MHKPDSVEAVLARLMPAALSEEGQAEIESMIDELAGETPETSPSRIRHWATRRGVDRPDRAPPGSCGRPQRPTQSFPRGRTLIPSHQLSIVLKFLPSSLRIPWFQSAGRQAENYLLSLKQTFQFSNLHSFLRSLNPT